MIYGELVKDIAEEISKYPGGAGIRQVAESLGVEYWLVRPVFVRMAKQGLLERFREYNGSAVKYKLSRVDPHQISSTPVPESNTNNYWLSKRWDSELRRPQ